MDNTKHTPGPWTFTMQEGYGKPQFTACFNSDNSKLADVKFAFLMHPSECNANARLIAAAPEMYEALKMLVDEAKAFGFDSTNVNCFEMARSAIARVEGEL
jgi:hypothetical protein